MYIKISGEYLGAEKEVVKYQDKKTQEAKQFSYTEGEILQVVPTETGEKLEVVKLRFPESFDPQSVPLKTEIEISGSVEYDAYRKYSYVEVDEKSI